MTKRKRSRSRTTAADPFVGSRLHEALVVLVAVKIVGIVLVVDPFGLQAFDLPKSLFSRAMAWPIAGVLVIALLRHGLAILPMHRLHAFVALFGLAASISTLFAPVPYIALHGERGSYLGMTFLLDMLVLYLAVAVGLRRAADRWILGGAVVLGFVLSVGYAAIQFVGLDPVRWSVAGRPFGTFGGTVRFAHFLGLVFGSALAVAAFAPTGRWEKVARAGGTGIALIAIATAGAVGSRGIFLGVVMGLAGLLMIGWVAQRFSPVRALQISSAVALVGVAAVAVLLTTPAGQRATTRVAEFAAEERLVIYQAAIEAAKARPLTGFGPDSFTVGYTAHRPLSTRGLGADVVENSAHNWILQAAATTGLIGVTTLIALLLAWTRAILSAARQGHVTMAAMLFAGSAAYWGQALVSVGTISVDWFPWVAFGATVATTGSRTEQAWSGLRLPAVVSAALVALFVLPMPAGLAAANADHAALSSSVAYRAKQSAAAIGEARRAVREDPGRADHWNWLGLGLTLAEDWKGSGDAFAEAAARAPYDSTYWQNLARSRTLQTLGGDGSSGGSDAAIAAGQRSIRVEPANQASYAVTAEIAFSLGRPELALQIALDAARVGIPVSDETSLKAAKVATDLMAARRSLQDLVAYQDAFGVRLGLAHVALKMNDLAAARENARRALELLPTSGEAREILTAAGG